MSMALMYTSIKPSPGPVHPSCPIRCSLDESKGPGAGSLPAQRCSLSTCRQSAVQCCPLCTSSPSWQAELTAGAKGTSLRAALLQPGCSSQAPVLALWFKVTQTHQKLHPGPQQAARDQGAAGAGAHEEQPGCPHPSASSCLVPMRAASSAENRSRPAGRPSLLSPTAQACRDPVRVSLQDAGASARAGLSRG